MRTLIRPAAAVATAVLLLAACAGDDTSPAEAGAAPAGDAPAGDFLASNVCGAYLSTIRHFYNTPDGGEVELDPLPRSDEMVRLDAGDSAGFAEYIVSVVAGQRISLRQDGVDVSNTAEIKAYYLGDYDPDFVALLTDSSIDTAAVEAAILNADWCKLAY